MKILEVVATYKKVPLRGKKSDAAYWRTLSYQDRLDALEQIRQEYHSWKGNAYPRFQRVYTIVKR